MNVIEKLNSIKNGEMTAKENVEGFIKVIDENNEEINAFIELNYENALKQAEAIDEKIAFCSFQNIRRLYWKLQCNSC